MRRPIELAVFLASLLAMSAAGAGQPHLVRDINPTIIPVDSSPYEFHDQGSWSYFQARDGVHGSQPWATNGTAAGTFPLDSVNPLPGVSSGLQFTRMNGVSYLFANSAAIDDLALWRTDGTAAGTRVVTAAASLGTNVSITGVLNNQLILSVYEADKGRKFWRTDGTDAGTVRISDVNGPATTDYAHVFANGKLYYLAGADAAVQEPWVWDGTAALPRRLAQIPDGVVGANSLDMMQAGHYIFFTATTNAGGKELWRIDLNDDSVAQVADIAPGATSGIDEAEFGVVGNIVLFKASSTGGTPMLWRSDGTAAGTWQIGNVAPISDFPRYAIPAGANRALFRVSAGSTAQIWGTDGSTATLLTTDGYFIGTVGSNVFIERPAGLWRSDGTAAGTRQLTGLPNAGSTSIELAGSDSQLFLRIKAATVSEYRYDLASDTAILLMAHPPVPNSNPNDVFGVGQGLLYFDALDPVTGGELYVSDGTPAGTHLLRNLAPETRTQPSSPQHLFAFHGKLFFSADDGIVGRELWISDGTEGGTQLVTDIAPGSNGSDPMGFFVLNDRLYFFAYDGGFDHSTYKLYTTDGTAAGTVKITAALPRESLYSGQGPCGATAVVMGSKAYLSLFEQGVGPSLWSFDGTAGGTIRLQDNATPLIEDPCELTVFKNRIFYTANQFGTVGQELFSAAAGAAPAPFIDLKPGTDGSSPASLQVFGDRLYFVALDSVSGFRQVWSTDGTVAGTRALANSAGQSPNSLSVANGKLFFFDRQAIPFSPAHLMATDGTTTAQVGAAASSGPLYSNGKYVFYSLRSPNVFDTAPWVSDGTAAGTHTLFDLGFQAPQPVSYFDFNGVTLAQAAKGAGDAMLWRTDGTRAGTTALGAIGVASTSTWPVTHRAAGQSFFYVSDANGSGAELFAIDNDRPVASDDAPGSVQAGQSLAIAVLANDSDSDGTLDGSSVTIASQPAGGTVAVAANGSVTYSASATFTGADQFTYSVADNQGARSPVATVRLTVTAAPVVTPPTTPPPTTPPPSGGGGGGGGALGILDLLAVVLLLSMSLARRRSHLSVA